jgi:hypothetical protein
LFKEGSILLYGIKSLSRRFHLLLSSCQQSDSLAFSDTLNQDQIQAACDKHGVAFDPGTVFNPATVLWGFLSQVIHKDELRSCLAAVARIGVMLVAMGRSRCAQNNGPYCRARSQFPLPVIRELAENVASGCEAQVPEEWLLNKRHLKLVDGTTVTMADTEENREAYPQQSCQKEGLGFPIARMVVLTSMATAMVIAMAMGPYSGKETGELALFRELLDQLDAGDIVVGDKYYCSYFMIALLLERGVDVVSLLHQARKIDVGSRKRIAKNDFLITWQRPDQPSWMDDETYSRMPETLELRLIHVNIHQPGFRTESLEIVTTLTDTEEYSVEELAAQYRQRWLVELDIRSIKCTMGMDVLRCKSPEMVRKEIWTCLLAYNLIRQKMLQAAFAKHISPREMSFTNALQVVAAGWMVAPLLDKNTREVLMQFELGSIASQLVGTRPDRIEPRAVKRRPKPYRLLTMMRDKAKALLRKGFDPFKKQK